MNMPQAFFGAIGLLERIMARAQGKGSGAGTVRREIRILQKLLSASPSLAIDIGGNVGNFTAELRKRHIGLEIHVFEPSQTNIAKLATRFKDDGLVTLVAVAVSDTQGSATLFGNKPGSNLSSLTRRNLEHFNLPFDTQETVNTVRFEDYWKTRLSCRQLDLVKIDVEGHELAVLKGFGAALDATSVLQFEFGGGNIDTRTFFQDFWYFFKERKFQIYRITPLGLTKITRYREADEYFSTTNYVAVNPCAKPHL